MGQTARRERQRKDYGAMRCQVQDGDLLLFQGHSLLSKIIRAVTGSPYSHAAIAMWWQPEGYPVPRLMVFEAVGQGVVVSPASKKVFEYSGQVDLYMLTEEARANLDRRALVDLCMDQLGKKFSDAGIALYGIRRLLSWAHIGSMFGGKDEPNPKTMFCSWYVSYVFTKAGQDLDEGHRSGLTSPADLARSPSVHYAGTLHYDPVTAERARLPDAATS